MKTWIRRAFFAVVLAVPVAAYALKAGDTGTNVKIAAGQSVCSNVWGPYNLSNGAGCNPVVFLSGCTYSQTEGCVCNGTVLEVSGTCGSVQLEGPVWHQQ